MNCPKCQQRIPSFAKSCPNCARNAANAYHLPLPPPQLPPLPPPVQHHQHTITPTPLPRVAARAATGGFFGYMGAMFASLFVSLGLPILGCMGCFGFLLLIAFLCCLTPVHH